MIAQLMQAKTPNAPPLPENPLLHKWRMWWLMWRVPIKMAMLSLPLRATGKVNSLIGIHPTRRFLILILTIEEIHLSLMH